ncbi:hypothetical protein DFS33DRAFT_1457031 [Desarmillaria ectypa]|nr:hypothetical protein DFS33DRAFT_1457031 [Desarmillaria ectypa]
MVPCYETYEDVAPSSRCHISKLLNLLPSSDKTDVAFLIEEYLRKVLKTHDETAKLIRFAVSPRRVHTFRNRPKLVFLRSERRRVKLDVKTAIRTLEPQMNTTDQDQRGQAARVQLLVTLLQRWKMLQRPAPIIGISEMSCFGCRLYFIAYRKACFQLQQQLLKLVHEVSRVHAKMCRRYSKSTPYSQEEEVLESLPEDLMRKWRDEISSWDSTQLLSLACVVLAPKCLLGKEWILFALIHAHVGLLQY